MTSYNPSADSTLGRKRRPSSEGDEEVTERSGAKKIKDEPTEELVEPAGQWVWCI